MLSRHPIFVSALVLVVCSAVVSLPVFRTTGSGKPSINLESGNEHTELFQDFVRHVRPSFEIGLEYLIELVELVTDTQEVQSICAIANAIKKTHDYLSKVVSITNAANSKYNDNIVSTTAKVGGHERKIQELQQQLADLQGKKTRLDSQAQEHSSLVNYHRSRLADLKDTLEHKSGQLQKAETAFLATAWIPFVNLITIPVLGSEMDKFQAQIEEVTSAGLVVLQSLNETQDALRSTKRRLQHTYAEMDEATRTKHHFESSLKKLKTERDNIARFLSLLKESDTFLQKFYGKVADVHSTNKRVIPELVQQFLQDFARRLDDILQFISSELDSQVAKLASEKVAQKLKDLLL